MKPSQALAEGRGALRGEANGARVLVRDDGAEAVAFLITLDRQEGVIVVPLKAGDNFIGRRGGTHEPFGVWPKPYAVEAAQWFIRCDAGHSEVWDAGSTSQSTLIAAHENAIAYWPGRPAEPTRYPLREGDILRCAYASFVFGWVEPEAACSDRRGQ